MNQIVLYDALSYIRVRLETERNPIMFLRGIVNDTANPYGTRIWVWDGQGGNDKRRAIFPPYKTSREYKPGIIKATDFVRELIDLSGAWQVRVPGFEGDDVIASLVEHFLRTTNLPIHIHGRDADLVALCGPRVSCSHTSKIPYADIRLYKVCVGDPSDDIPGIKGFGEKGWAECDRQGLRALITKLLDERRPLADEEEGKALAVGLRPGSCNWLKVQENIDSLAAMRRCIEPLPVPQNEINKYLKRGVRNEIALHQKMTEFHL